VKLIKKKKRAWRTARFHGTTDNFDKYKDLEKQVKKKIRNAKRNIEKQLANAQNSNPRTFANYIKSKTKSRTGIKPLKNGNGRLITEDLEIAAELNNFFSSVFTEEETSNLPVLEREGNATLNTTRITTVKIRDKIKKLRENSAPGPDGITAKLLKTACEELLLPLKLIYELSLSTGSVPAEWRTADVTPIYKKGPKGEAGNYRPVSLTSIPCKILETIIKDDIMAHLMNHRLIKDSQHGFMPRRSCATNLVIFQDRVTKAIDSGVPVDIFFLDFAKAFDKVPKQRLLIKLR